MPHNQFYPSTTFAHCTNKHKVEFVPFIPCGCSMPRQLKPKHRHTPSDPLLACTDPAQVEPFTITLKDTSCKHCGGMLYEGEALFSCCDANPNLAKTLLPFIAKPTNGLRNLIDAEPDTLRRHAHKVNGSLAMASRMANEKVHSRVVRMLATDCRENSTQMWGWIGSVHTLHLMLCTLCPLL